MSEAFVKGIKREDNFTTTENGATALKSTYSSLVDLFGQIGAFRSRSDFEIETAFSKAFAEDKLLALKLAFYSRDIRNGGLGERRVFRIICKFLAKIHPDVIAKNIENIPVFGRFDDLYEFVGTSIESYIWNVIRKQWITDLENMRAQKPISLMAKWLKSVNTSSESSNNLGKKTARALGLSEKQYRKTLAEMRKYIDVVEVKMSDNEWNNIKYPSVPSRAMKIYHKAYAKHDPSGYESFISKVEKGEEKIKATTLYPYDIFEAMGFYPMRFRNHDRTLEQQWKALPNYVEGENNVLIMADTSGSMIGRPMCTSVGLAMYFAERNHGVFKDKFLTFSERPSFVELKGETLYERVRCVPEIVANTNLEAAFRLILNVAVENRLTAADMPKSLVIISDMQFDSATQGWGSAHETFYETMRKMYERAGYSMPNIIFWNVASRSDTFQVTSDYKGVQLASGQGVGIFKSILKNIGCTPYEAMVNTLSDPVYDCIKI